MLESNSEGLARKELGSIYIGKTEKRKSRRQFGSCWFMMNPLGFGKQPMACGFVPVCLLVLCHSERCFLAYDSSTVSAVQHPACVIRLCVSLISAFLFKVKWQIPDLWSFPSAYLSRAEINLSGRLVQLRACE